MTEVLDRAEPTRKEIQTEDIKKLTDTVKRQVGAFATREFELPHARGKDEATETRGEALKQDEAPKTRREALEQEAGITRVIVSYDRASATKQIRILAQEEQKPHQEAYPYEEITFDLDDGVYKPSYEKGTAKLLENGLTEFDKKATNEQEAMEGYMRIEAMIFEIESPQNPQHDLKIKNLLGKIKEPFKRETFRRPPTAKGRHVA